MIETIETDPQVEAFNQALLDRSARQRLPELFHAPPREALAHLPNREGVSVVAIRSRSLPHDQLLQVLTYRLAQYVLLRYFDPRLVYEARLQHEPLDHVAPDDVHVISGDADTGEILCYVVIKAGPDAPAGTPVRACDRPPFPVEQIYGHGIYKRLRILPDLPVARVRELERFVKNHQRHSHDELAIRAPVETVLAAFRLLATALRSEVEAITGDLEEGVAKRNLDFFQIPIALIHGVVPYVAPDACAWPAYQSQIRYPFAFLCSDIPLRRLDMIERALIQPGKEGLIALLQLKDDTCVARSSLEPRDGLEPLDDAPVPQEGVPMAIRREALTLGKWLRSSDLFEDLSVAEATVLGTFLERCAAAPGDTIVRQGELGDDLYLIESGTADVQVVTRAGHRLSVATLGPGSCFGEIALVTGGERTADVVALAPMRLLRLSRDAYARYLAHLIEVDRQVTHTALERLGQTLRVVRSEER